jgi:replicative DNA helicase
MTDLYSDPAEAALIGCLGFHGNEIHHLIEAVSPQDFWKPARETIWSAAKTLVTTGQPIDPSAIVRKLQADGVLNQSVERVVAFEMTTSCPVEIAGKYSETVIEMSRRRELHRACQRAIDITVNHQGSTSEALSLVMGELDKLAAKDEDPSTLTWRQLIDEFEDTHAPGGARPGIPSPWWEL